MLAIITSLKPIGVWVASSRLILLDVLYDWHVSPTPSVGGMAACLHISNFVEILCVPILDSS